MSYVDGMPFGVLIVRRQDFGTIMSQSHTNSILTWTPLLPFHSARVSKFGGFDPIIFFLLRCEFSTGKEKSLNLLTRDSLLVWILQVSRNTCDNIE